jgi:hypothetical protein
VRFRKDGRGQSLAAEVEHRRAAFFKTSRSGTPSYSNSVPSARELYIHPRQRAQLFRGNRDRCGDSAVMVI